MMLGFYECSLASAVIVSCLRNALSAVDSIAGHDAWFYRCSLASAVTVSCFAWFLVRHGSRLLTTS